MDGGRAGRLVGEWRGRRAGRWVGEWRGRTVSYTHLTLPTRSTV